MKTLIFIFAVFATACFAAPSAGDLMLDGLLPRLTEQQRVELSMSLREEALWSELFTMYQILPVDMEAKATARAYGLRMAADYVDAWGQSQPAQVKGSTARPDEKRQTPNDK